MAQTKETIAREVYQMHRDELTEAIMKIPNFSRFLSRLCVKKLVSIPGKNTATVCELMGRKFQTNMTLSLIDDQIAKNYKCLLDFIKVLKKEPSLYTLGVTIEGVYKQFLESSRELNEVDFNADSEPETSQISEEEVTKSKIHRAALHGYLRTVKKCIEEKGTDPWTRDENGNALVHYASISGSIDLMEYLVKEHYCSPTAMGEGGLTPLHLAAQFDHLDLVKYLIDELEADPNFPDEEGNIALHFAAQSNASHSLEYLTDNKKCDPTRRNHDGYTSVHLACLGGALETLEQMTADPAPLSNLSSKSNEGITPLHLACRSGNLEVVKYLVDRGCDPNCNDGYMKLPLHYASKAGNLEVVQYLVTEKRSNVKCKDRDGCTPLDLANNAGHTAVAAFLKLK